MSHHHHSVGSFRPVPRTNRPRIAVPSLLILLPLLMGADVYRYIDKDGVVTYTQQLPYGVQGERVRTGTTAGPSTQTVRDLVPGAVETTDTSATPTAQPNEKVKLTKEQQAMLDELKRADDARKQELAKIRQANCERARGVLERLEASGRLRVRDESGAERNMPEEERSQRVQEAQEGVVTNCDPTS